MLVVKDYISTAFYSEDVDRLDVAIRPILANMCKVVLDFTGINMFSTVFFNRLLLKYVGQLGYAVFLETFAFVGLVPLGYEIYSLCLQAVETYLGMSYSEKLTYTGMLKQAIEM